MTTRAFVGPSYHASTVVGWGQSLLFPNVTDADFWGELTRGLGVHRPLAGFPGLGWAALDSLGFTAAMLKTPTSATNVLVCLGGNGDLTTGTDGIPTYALLAAQCSAAYAAGFDKIIGCTIPKFAPGQGSPGDMDTQRLAYNAAIRSDVSNAFDAVADLAADPRMQDNSDLDYFVGDGVHWNANGAHVGAMIVRPYLEMFL